MSYNSPIKIIAKKLTSKIEDDIMSVVQSYDIEVDKERLLQCLQHDYAQYERGYRDGKDFRHDKGVKPYKDGTRWHCGECFVAIGRYWKFCQYCGQKIGWDEVKNENVE